MNTGETEGFENLITVVELHIKELNTSAFQNVFPDIGFHQIYIYSLFDKLSQLNQREIVENKRLGAVLNHIQQQHEELEQQNKRNRSQKMPSRRAQKTAIQERNLNPVLDLEMSI